MSRNWVLLLFCFNGISSSFGQKKTLHVGVLLELSKYWYRQYSAFIVNTMEYYFSRIDNDTSILDGFDFRMTVSDTEGNNGMAAAKLIEVIKEGEPKVAIIGPTSSSSMTVVGQISPVFNVLHLSCIAITASTVQRQFYSTLISVNQASNLLNPLRIRIMKHFEWTRVGTIVYQDDISVSQMNQFHTMLEENNMTLVTSAVFSSTTSFKDIMTAFKQFDVRIIMAAVHGNEAPSMFCEAYRQGMTGESYVWILAGATLHRGWLSTDYTDGCSLEELTRAVDGYFSLYNLISSQADQPTISGKTPEEEMETLKSMLAELPSDQYRMSAYIPYVVDTAWALALGLNNSIKYLDEMGLSLHNYSYSPQFREAIMRGMLETSFIGFSGPVSFAEDGSRVGITYIKRSYANASRDTMLVYYDVTKDELTWTMPQELIWTDGRVPRDKFTYREFIVHTPRTTVIAILFVNALGFTMSTGFLVFNIYFRNTRSIKMSSPMINNVIILGCMIMYTEVFVTGSEQLDDRTDTPIGANCIIRAWLVAVGFTLLFGALFSKTYRVYVMFRDYKMRNKFIKDYHLFGLVAGLLCVDAILLVPWSVFFTPNSRRIVFNYKDAFDNNVITSNVYLYCDHPLETYWTVSVYVYKGLLLVFGVFLAWETRNVTIPELNDSKYIGGCIYNVVIVCTFGVPILHVLPIEQQTLKFVLEACLIFFCTTICQCILFIPKIQGRNRVQGRMIQVHPSTNTGSSSAPDTMTTKVPASAAQERNNEDETGSPRESYVDPNERCELLERENRQLRHELTTESIAVAKLKKSILALSGNIHFYRSGEEYVVFRRKTSLSAGVDNLDVPTCSKQ